MKKSLHTFLLVIFLASTETETLMDKSEQTGYSHRATRGAIVFPDSVKTKHSTPPAKTSPSAFGYTGLGGDFIESESAAVVCCVYTLDNLLAG